MIHRLKHAGKHFLFMIDLFNYLTTFKSYKTHVIATIYFQSLFSFSLIVSIQLANSENAKSMVVGPFGPNSAPVPEHVVEVFLDDTESVPFPDPRTEVHSVKEMTLKQNPVKHNPVQFMVDTVNGVVMDLVLLHVEMVGCCLMFLVVLWPRVYFFISRGRTLLDYTFFLAKSDRSCQKSLLFDDC